MDCMICKICEAPFGDQQDYDEHSKFHVLSYNVLRCEKCDINFERQKQLNDHLWKHLGVFPCPQCDEKFLDPNDLDVHEDRDHIDSKDFFVAPELMDIYNDPTPTTTDHQQTNSQQTNYHQPTGYQPNTNHYRDRPSTKINYLRDFKKTVHDMEHTEKFICALCLKTFGTKSKLKVHIDLHLNPDLFKCENCSKKFTTAGHLRKHKLLEIDPDMYKCKLCPKRFQHQSHLRDHVKLHENAKAFKCGVCFRVFSRRDFLNAHLKLHNNPDLYKCNVCSRRFSGINYLNTHLLTHSEEDRKVLECRYCNKLLASKNNLKAHEMKCKDLPSGSGTNVDN